MEESTRGIFTGSGGMSKFFAIGGGISPIPSAEKACCSPQKKAWKFLNPPYGLAPPEVGENFISTNI